VAQLDGAKEIYIATERKNGTRSKPVPVWFGYMDNAVWFTANSAKGPWAVADSVPSAEIDKIPPSEPVYNVKSVTVYETTKEVVYVGYTPGYVWSYPWYGVPIYGTGWYYPPYVSPYAYYPRPCTWGMSVSYNPYTGWGFGMTWSNGFLTVGVGFGGMYGGHYGGYYPPYGYRPPYYGGYPGYGRPGGVGGVGGRWRWWGGGAGAVGGVGSGRRWWVGGAGGVGGAVWCWWRWRSRQAGRWKWRSQLPAGGAGSLAVATAPRSYRRRADERPHVDRAAQERALEQYVQQRRQQGSRRLEQRAARREHPESESRGERPQQRLCRPQRQRSAAERKRELAVPRQRSVEGCELLERHEPGCSGASAGRLSGQQLRRERLARRGRWRKGRWRKGRWRKTLIGSGWSRSELRQSPRAA
jgi:hypothetical protein